MTSLYELLLRDEMETADARRKLARKIKRGDVSATVEITPPTPVDDDLRGVMRFYQSDASKTRTVDAISVPKYREAIERLETGAMHSDVLLKAVKVCFTDLPCQESHSDDSETSEPLAHDAADDAALPTVGNPSFQAPTNAGPVAPPPVDTTRAVPAQRFQEQEILRVIAELGYDAKNLPKYRAGSKGGAKSKVRERLELSKKVFDLAWERLRKNTEIADA